MNTNWQNLPPKALTRTYGHYVAGLSTEEALDAAGMNYKVIPLPLLAQGNSQNIKVDNHVALYRSDARPTVAEPNPQPLAIATKSYTVFQNAQILSIMKAAAEAAGVEIERLGEYDGGRRIWAVTTLKSDRARAEISVGDIVALKLRMISGHEPGIALRIQAIVERLTCLNGATSKRVKGSVSIAHRRALTMGDLQNIEALYTSSIDDFNSYVEDARLLRDTPTNGIDTRLIVAELLAGSSAVDDIIGRQVPRARSANPGETRGSYLQDMARLIAARGATGLAYGDSVTTRTQNLLWDVVDETERRQLGRDLALGTLWGTYNGVTSYINHRSGRTLDSGLESAFVGNGSKTMEKAFDLITEFAAARQDAA